MSKKNAYYSQNAFNELEERNPYKAKRVASRKNEKKKLHDQGLEEFDL